MACNVAASTIAPSGLDGELTTISFVRLVIFDRIAFASRRHSGGSMLYATGVAPASRASVAYETKPGFGTSTSSPGSTKAWKIANSPSCVPAVTQISLFGSNGVPAASSLRSASEPAFGV